MRTEGLANCAQPFMPEYASAERAGPEMQLRELRDLHEYRERRGCRESRLETAACECWPGAGGEDEVGAVERVAVDVAKSGIAFLQSIASEPKNCATGTNQPMLAVPLHNRLRQSGSRERWSGF